ncbi:MAG: hypothetical protein M3326_15105, partial [Actinomycetota bacterium]|nr:hypothetical protein [Actinomycetota bacterium]
HDGLPRSGASHSAQWELECTMLELCEAYHAATWVAGFEYEVWQLLVSARRDWTRVVREDSEDEAAANQLGLLDSIRVLSERTRCWIVMDDHMSSRPVPLGQWRRTYRQSGWETRNPLPPGPLGALRQIRRGPAQH